MSVFQPGQIAYGFSQALIGVPIQTIVAQRVPNSNDKAPLGTFWVDTLSNQVFVITSIVDNVATWATVATGGVANQFNADTGTAFPSGGIINVFGGDNIVTSATGNTITISTTGNIDLPATNAAGTQGIYKIGGVDFGFMFPPTSVYVGNAGNTSNNPLLAINNVGVGNNAITLVTTGNNNTALGTESLQSLTTGTNNVGVGHFSLNALDSGDSNVAIGNLALESLDNGDENIALGFSAGSNYVGSESDNILIGNQGVAAENNVIRIGTQGSGAGQQNQCFVAGIYNDTPAGTYQVMFVDNAGKLGSSTGTDGQIIIGSSAGSPEWANVTAGTNVVITNGNNSIEVSVPGLGTEVIDGDTGSASGPVLTFTAIAAGASTSFSATGTVVTLNLEDASQNVIIGKTAGGGAASGNVGIGHNVFHDLIATGDANIAIGLDALNAITTGTENIGIGVASGTNYTSTESSNIVIGNAGTIGESNIARIGTTGSGTGQITDCFIAGTVHADTGLDVTSGNIDFPATTSISAGVIDQAGQPFIHSFGDPSNVFVGQQAQGSFTASNLANIGIGFQSLYSLTSGIGNNAVGYQTLYGVTTGNTNTVIGNDSCAGMTTGTNNTAVGAECLINAAGSYNTFLGFECGIAATAGTESSNIYIQNAGLSGENNIGRIGTTGSGNSEITDCFIAGTVHADTGLEVTTGDLTVFTGNAIITGGNLEMNNSHSIVVGGNPYINFYASTINNVYIGLNAGNPSVSGQYNGCLGESLQAITTGSSNYAIGDNSQNSMTTGDNNVSVGFNMFNSLTTGVANVAVGAGFSFPSLTTGQRNVAIGVTSGTNYTGAESDNLILGSDPGVVGESNVIRIGLQGTGTNEQNVCYIAGIFGSTVGVSGVPVVVDNTGLMGTVVSSRRYKENISDMDDASRPIMDLRPVTFNLKNDKTHERRFGLIAEEVEEIIPDLVVLNKDGDPETVKYQDLPVLLLNELQRQHNIIAELSRRLQRLEGRAKYESKD